MIAFKEWQVVCKALAEGRQTVILRKGGIHEGREGFAWKHESFALFPTRFHAQREGVKPEDWAAFGEEELSEWQEGEVVPIQWECEVERAVTLSTREEVEALRDLHIWTDEVIRERFDWEMKGMKGQSLHAAFVKVREIHPTLDVVYQKRCHGGCRSWLELEN
ncbi:DUF1802 family protein [Roseibacillus persicicus]|uniref:DUF1802 family protein n=1 Tax=Roseibacillus persicicus TaxID=454148 RepID=A0A918TTP9_9BACT|nr:DUF1802 family protein [Roseibacillus persicicus]GHC62480.1 hypothetical protein GCM10007100_32380 [Roseibacillus persicicus]